MKKVLSIAIFIVFVFTGLITVTNAGGVRVEKSRCDDNNRTNRSFCGASYTHVASNSDGTYVSCSCVKKGTFKEGSSNVSYSGTLCGNLLNQEANTYISSMNENIKKMKKGQSNNLIIMDSKCQNSCNSGYMWGYRNVRGSKVLTGWNSRKCR